MLHGTPSSTQVGPSLNLTPYLIPALGTGTMFTSPTD